MKYISRKINLQHYGGNAYETADFYVEGDDFETIKLELNQVIVSYISELKEQDKLFKSAISKIESKSIIGEKQQARHDIKKALNAT